MADRKDDTMPFRDYTDPRTNPLISGGKADKEYPKDALDLTNDGDSGDTMPFRDQVSPDNPFIHPDSKKLLFGETGKIDKLTLSRIPIPRSGEVSKIMDDYVLVGQSEGEFTLLCPLGHYQGINPNDIDPGDVPGSVEQLVSAGKFKLKVT